MKPKNNSYKKTKIEMPRNNKNEEINLNEKGTSTKTHSQQQQHTRGLYKACRAQADQAQEHQSRPAVTNKEANIEACMEAYLELAPLAEDKTEATLEPAIMESNKEET